MNEEYKKELLIFKNIQYNIPGAYITQKNDNIFEINT